MKKYDLSEIMKRAWQIIRMAERKNIKMTFAEALKFSWMIAKKAESLKKEWYEPDGIVSFNLWMVPGHIRAYYKCDWMSKYANNKKTNFVEFAA